jgi:thiamine biosynthesis lipoprotein
MKQTRFLMGMPVIVEVVDPEAAGAIFDQVYAYFEHVDQTFSTYKDDSEISRLNRGELSLSQASDEMKEIFALAEQTRQESQGYFDIRRGGYFDPSGIVKGWAIQQAAGLLEQAGYRNYYVYAGGDIQAAGTNAQGQPWRVGIQNPFNPAEMVKVLSIRDRGVATSGTYARGMHIYNPREPNETIHGIVSLTVTGPNIYEADRFATAAFAMGPAGIRFIDELDGFEGYMIDPHGIATYTRGFEKLVAHA